MQLVIQTKTRLTLLSAGLAVVLSACGGGSSSNNSEHDFDQNPTPPAPTTYFGKLATDVKLFTGYDFGMPGSSGASIDSSANITLSYNDPSSTLPSYNFTFPSGLPGGSVSGNLFTIQNNSQNKEINILTPSLTKTVQNVFWKNIDDPSYFGFSLAGYINYAENQKLPTTGTVTFSGKAFQYIVDSNESIADKTTYALYVSDATATADYSTNTFTVSIAPNANLIKSIGNPTVINVDPSQFASTYIVTNMEHSGLSFQDANSWTTPPRSGLELPARHGALSHFGSNAQELAGLIRYSGDVTNPDGPMTRDQFVSFALVKQ